MCHQACRIRISSNREEDQKNIFWRKVQRAELFVQTSQREPYLKKLDCAWSWVLSCGNDILDTDPSANRGMTCYCY
jgi:hypothetical protein